MLFTLRRGSRGYGAVVCHAHSGKFLEQKDDKYYITVDFLYFDEDMTIKKVIGSIIILGSAMLIVLIDQRPNHEVEQKAMQWQQKQLICYLRT